MLVKQDLLQARGWYERAADQGYAVAQSALASLLTGGNGIPVDYPAGVHWYRKAIKQGDSSAAYNLGIIYRDMGKSALAYRWYATAAKMGDKDAFLQMGLCSLFGFGVKKDFREARKCFVKVTQAIPYRDVSRRSFEDAHYWMAVMAMAGMGVRKSVSSARKLLEIADENRDHEQASALLAVFGRTEQITRGA